MVSTSLLCYLLINLEDLTPDFFHFVTCFEPVYGHYIWIFLVWSTYKCYFEHLPYNTMFTSKADLILSILEGFLGLLISGHLRECTVFIFSLGFLLFKLLNEYPKQTNLAFWMFLFQYVI